MIKRFVILSLIIFSFGNSKSQSIDDQIKKNEEKIRLGYAKIDSLKKVREGYKFLRIQHLIETVSLPELLEEEVLIKHSAMFLVYSEEHEQAKWVAHVITPDIIEGKYSRSNDFRVDSLIKTGSAVEADYFLKEKLSDGKYKYDGFGYDRGHLAPSADFKWSKKALSESYFYSNMSPQVGDFNRKKWAELESLLRGYVVNNPTVNLYVITGPVLKRNLPVIERGVNKVSIPEQFFKVALDFENKRAIGFLMLNVEIEDDLIDFVASVDSIEIVTGINFFDPLPDTLEDRIESKFDFKHWMPKKTSRDAKVIHRTKLPKGCINTPMAWRHINSYKDVTVCGTVVSSYKSQKGNIFLNLDRAYPNTIFTVMIRNDDIVNFSYGPEKSLINTKVCVKGKITEFKSVPTLTVGNEVEFRVLEENYRKK